ncbi:acylphosphatase [Uliginosibacterium sp. TH139]|nr:acylphosphatase [Uliginosibacterium sp. TH139]
MSGSEAALSADQIVVGRRLRVSGTVQGVGFRWFVCSVARELGLQGWVRNLRSGQVEVLVWGAQPQVVALIHHVSLGPPHARVDALEVEDSAERTAGFDQRPTI